MVVVVVASVVTTEVVDEGRMVTLVQRIEVSRQDGVKVRPVVAQPAQKSRSQVR